LPFFSVILKESNENDTNTAVVLLMIGQHCCWRVLRCWSPKKRKSSSRRWKATRLSSRKSKWNPLDRSVRRTDLAVQPLQRQVLAA